MPDPAAPAPPPAACLGAIEREVRRHRIIERAPGGWRTGSIAEPVDLGSARSSGRRSSCAGVDPAGASPLADRQARRPRPHGRRRQGAGRRRARRPDGGAPPSPARASICLQSSDFARSAAKCISKCIQNERICRATRPGAPPRAGSRTAARRRPARVSICLQPSDLPRSGEKSISKCIHNERICRARRGADPGLRRPGARGGSRGQEGKGMSHRPEAREHERPAARSHAAVAPSGQGDRPGRLRAVDAAIGAAEPGLACRAADPLVGRSHCA